MQAEVVMQGLALGLAYAAPIGIQNMFVINAALTRPRGSAMVCGLVVAFFDCTLALACFYGIGTVIDVSPVVRTAFLLVGGSVLIVMGGKMLFASRAGGTPGDVAPKFWSVVWMAFVLTWVNPQALIDGSLILGAMYASLAVEQHLSFIGGMCAASLLWFTVLALLVSTFKTYFSEKLLRVVNAVCGGIIVIFGVRLLFRLA